MTLVVRDVCPKSFLPDVICGKFKGPCGHDTGRSGRLPQIILPDFIFGKFKGPCGHDTGRSGRLPQIMFAGLHFLEI